MSVYKLEIKREKVSEEDVIIRNSSDTLRFIHSTNIYKDENLWREKLSAIFLNKSNKVLGYSVLSTGGHDKTIMDLKEIGKYALGALADNVILIHNHPSGNPMPGKTDIDETQKIRTGLKTLQIHLLDHIIIGEGKYFSFQEETIKPIQTL